MQLSSWILRVVTLLSASLMTTMVWAEARVQSTNTYIHEGGNPTHMTVFSPQVNAAADVVDEVSVDAGWSADIVSGASVSVVDAPSSSPDIITSATKLNDFRQVIGGGVGIQRELTSFRAGYSHGFEKDYRSNAIQLSAATELFDRNTRLELRYGRGFDQVCTLNQPQASQAVDKNRMPSSDGCFGGADRATESVTLQTLQVGWTQSWTPILATQLVLGGQLIDGFQSNPYRGVWLGRSSALENHPRERIRYSVDLGTRLWVDATQGALHVDGRVYRDSWDVRAFAVNLAYEQNITPELAVQGRMRFYSQGSASFYSDDYTRSPQGQYFTGDRELSTMRNTTFGGRLTWQPTLGDDAGSIWAGMFHSFALVLKADLVLYDFKDFHYGAASVPNRQSFLVTAALNSAF